MNIAVSKPPLTIRLCGPRGFCAGVDRAIQIVERALEKYGAPVYVRHEIVHNKFVVDSLKEQGAIFRIYLPKANASVLPFADGTERPVTGGLPSPKSHAYVAPFELLKLLKRIPLATVSSE